MSQRRSGATMSLVFLLSAVCLAVVHHQDVSSYFERRKQALRQEKVSARPRLKSSFVPEEYYKSVKSCNPHDFKYMINQPKLCSRHNRVLLLVAIRSVYKTFDRRMAIRTTWGNKENYRATVVFVFLFANHGNKWIQERIQMESEVYGDIIQEDFVDSYVNVTLKAAMAWKWAVNFCPNADFVMVMNDEAYVDPFKMVPLLRREKQRQGYRNRFSICFLIKGIVTHLTHYRYKKMNRRDLYIAEKYPRYCHGVAYVAPTELINKLFLMSLDTRPVMPSDAWIGILSEKIGIKIYNNNSLFRGISKKNVSPLLDAYLIRNYTSSLLLIGVTDYHFKGTETFGMNYIWHLILKHHNQIKADKIRKSMDSGYFSTSQNYLYTSLVIFNFFFILVMLCSWKRNIFCFVCCKKSNLQKR